VKKETSTGAFMWEVAAGRPRWPGFGQPAILRAKTPAVASKGHAARAVSM
jgi:hypothetical protein